jgi:hypothetical protein
MMQIAEGAVSALEQMGPLRITGEEVDDEVELEIEPAGEPVAGDIVVELRGARVFLDPVAAEALDDQTLGVEGHDDHFHFTFDPQDG